jgi:hypothetical protein
MGLLERIVQAAKKTGCAGAVPSRTGDIYQGFIIAKFLSHKARAQSKTIQNLNLTASLIF